MRHDPQARYFISTRGVGMSWRPKRRPLLTAFFGLILLIAAIIALVNIASGHPDGAPVVVHHHTAAVALRTPVTTTTTTSAPVAPTTTATTVPTPPAVEPPPHAAAQGASSAVGQVPVASAPPAATTTTTTAPPAPAPSTVPQCQVTWTTTITQPEPFPPVTVGPAAGIPGPSTFPVQDQFDGPCSDAQAVAAAHPGSTVTQLS